MSTPTLLLTNGKIWCGLEEGFAEAIAMAEGRVLATGTTAEIEAMAAPGCKVVDLGGRLATPGLNDGHMHLHNYGLNLLQIDLRPAVGVTSIGAMLDKVKEAVARAPKGAWIIGRGYDHDKFTELRHATRAEVDAVAPDNPVFLVRTCGHTAIANSLALEAGGIDEDTPDPFGGKIGRHGNGALNGLLFENARQPVQQAMPQPTLDDLVDAIERGGKDYLTYGVTSVMEAGIGIMGLGMTELRAYQKALADGRLPVRVAGTLMGDAEKNIIEECHAEGLVTGAGCDMFRIGPVKIFTDGSAGAGTAWMSEPYFNDPENYGVPCLTQEQCDELVLKAHSMGYQMAPHAIGDAAIEMVLNSYEKAYAEMPAPDRRHRIEHCGWHRPDQLERMKEMGVIPAGQPSFLYFFGDGYFMCLGPDRPHTCYPFKTWLESGLHPSGSTDCPVTSASPFPVLYGLIARTSDTGQKLGAGEELTVEQALHCCTYESAYGVHEENVKGRLIPGQLADVAVFDTDFFEVAPEEILKTSCVMTILGGEIVYETGQTVAKELA
ncbi:amidohydrolase [Maritimibacter alkaliphilus]|uniref:amidohydrolase n=1 Tax=Maritimibacter alkaliphilus TaxID=404236 RepID=UPI001C96445A|nr:amidohydrolase [Maritimibacter alkaliphilus]MBY6092251.1 amidohydrolase [Maritimibacter alkaliphilus]